LFADSMDGAGIEEATAIPAVERIAVGWIFDLIHTDADVRAAVRTLATVFQGNEDLVAFGQFNGLDDEWTGGWRRGRR
jgi:hypothetical protein